MKIAIIDVVNQDIGLKILFPEADYFINNTEECTIQFRNESNSYYKIINNYDFTKITDVNYDMLFILLPIYDIVSNTPFYKKHIKLLSDKIQSIISNNNFKKVFIFDNYDYDYDPSKYFINDKIDIYFKRNYNKNKPYCDKVVPFPFIMFGEISIIEKCDRELVSKEEYFKNKFKRVFFTGGLYKHEDPQYNIVRDRISIYNKIQRYIYNPGRLHYNIFLEQLRNSMFGLDLLGVGEPNKRTFEILLSGSLLISEKHDMKWPFDDEFCDEIFFSNEREFYDKVFRLYNDNNLYLKCLNKQYDIVRKYFNKEWIRNYIISKI